jgi:galactokinase
MMSGSESVVAHVPGRAEWLGNHTDYNDELVLGVGLEAGVT